VDPGRRIALASILIVAIGAAFATGYTVGRGERTIVPDLYRFRSGKALGILRSADLRIGRTRYVACGGESAEGMIVKQFPRAGESVPLRSAVDIWEASIPERTDFGGTPGAPPCRRDNGSR
jgi:beta-lactam-binding protein with PASTA domain